jgi:antitoxin component YwqK of YwqJK toxin-antitoxin module
MEYQEEFEDGLFIGRGIVENGLKEGSWRYYYSTGELKQEVDYLHGIEHGNYKYFGKDGKLLISATNVYGLLNGEWQEYYEDGRIKEIGRYTNNEFFPMDFWDYDGSQLLKNGTGKRIEEYGVNALVDIYEQYYEDGHFVKEIKIQGYKYLGFRPEKKDGRGGK